MNTATQSHPTRAVLAELDRGAVRRASDMVLHKHRHGTSEPVATAIPDVDELLGGGLPNGALTEFVGPPSCGRFATLLAVLQQITSTGEPAALVDQGGHLDPQGARSAGVDLARLLWVRPQRLPDTLAAAEILIATGFPLVAVDLGLPPVKGRASLAAWLRLARRAAEHESVVLVASPYRLSGCAARMVLKAGRSRGAWGGRTGEIRVLEGLRGRLELAKYRDRQPDGTAARLTLTLPEAAFGAPAESTPCRKELSHVQCT